MDRLLLLDGVRKLEELETGDGNFAWSQGVRQFNKLLEDAKSQLAARHDIQALEPFQNVDNVLRPVYRDAFNGSEALSNCVRRLRSQGF